MSTAKNAIDRKLLKTLDPLARLSHDKIEELVTKATVEEIAPGRTLFRQGERDKRTLYLLTGQVEVTAAGKLGSRVIKAKSEEARQPLVPELPRTCTARTRGPCTVLSIDSDLLEILLGEGKTDAYEVTELSGDDDASVWMFRFLQSPAFLNLPTENIQALIMRMEELPAKRGTVILKQGDLDDYYYIVKQGSCQVTRRPTANSKEIKLATLSVGDGFGEEALITGGKRNATISMLEDGVLMRLAKDDFHKLLVHPLLKYVSHDNLAAMLTGGAQLVDVRGPEAFMQSGLQGASNVPLSVLRLKLAGLDPQRTYITYCDDGNRAAAAAFLMSQQGLQAYVLRGGLTMADPARMRQQPAPSPSEQIPPPSASTSAPAAVRHVAEDYERRVEAAESARNQAEQQAARLRAEAEAARQTAEREAAKLKAQATAVQRAELEAVERRASDEGRRAAAAEAARQRAEEELVRLRREAEAARAEAERRVAQHTRSADQARQAAEQQAERLKAEAEAARRRAEQEAERSAAAEAARQKAEQEAERLRTVEVGRKQAEIEAARREAAEAARQAQAAEAARRAALEEAARLKAESEAARDQALREAAVAAERARREAELDAQRMLAEEVSRKQAEIETARRQASEAARLAQSADAARRAAQEEANRLKAEAETIRRQAQLEAEKLKAEAEAMRAQAAREAAHIKSEELARAQAALDAAQRRADEEARRAQVAEEARRLSEQRANEVLNEAEARLKKADQARQLAAAIANRLKAVERKRAEQQRAPEVAPAVPKTDRKLVIEAEDDIFVFMEPSSEDAPAPQAVTPAPPTPAAKEPAAPATRAASRPFAAVPPAPVLVEEAATLADDEGLADTLAAFRPPVLDDEEPARPVRQRPYWRGLGALAAALVLFVGAAAVVGNVPWHALLTQFSGDEHNTAQREPTRSDQTQLAARIAAEKSKAEARVVQDAESDFTRLLGEWRDKLKNMPLLNSASAPNSDAVRADQTANGLGRTLDADGTADKP